MSKLYREGVCAVIRRKSDDSVLVCHRNGYPPEFGWQFPQGGVDGNLELIEELFRELREEIGTDNVTVLKVSRCEYRYDFPDTAKSQRPQYVGQIHRWVLAELNGGDETIHFEYKPSEFDGFEWVSPREALERIVDFKKDAYFGGLHDLGLIDSPE